ncbi:hypothetical protein N1851_018306 [Merluccius polli]|uniref:Uncharacterized protein n=1 Tax=Merluccius polli TaxID=89951 RepID=A0AA47MP56_MERPO|nr:hypothetical protein N1851_018306 [Merluccius polli]
MDATKLSYHGDKTNQIYLTTSGSPRKVLREDKATTKLRIVFDASSHENCCPSLNDCLLTGPNLNPALLDIALADGDKDAVRFLWLHGPTIKDCDDELRIMRMNRVLFGVSPSPFLLAATIRKHLQQYETEQPKTVKALRESYVDDYIASSCDVEEAYSVTTGVSPNSPTSGVSPSPTRRLPTFTHRDPIQLSRQSGFPIPPFSGFPTHTTPKSHFFSPKSPSHSTTQEKTITQTSQSPPTSSDSDNL